jgi:hypothetical protein
MVKIERLKVPNSSVMSLPYSCCARTENIDTTTAKMIKVLARGYPVDAVAITMRWSDLKRENIRTILRILKLRKQTDTQKQRNRQVSAGQTYGQARMPKHPVRSASLHASSESSGQTGRHAYMHGIQVRKSSGGESQSNDDVQDTECGKSSKRVQHTF